MNGPGCYCVQYFPEGKRWITTKDRYTWGQEPEINKVYYFSGEFRGEWTPEEYWIFLDSVGDIAAFTRGANMIENYIRTKDDREKNSNHRRKL